MEVDSVVPEDPTADQDALAQKFYDSGCAALKENDVETAADDISKALEIRVSRHGELAPECALTYYKYGCVLLHKVQLERDVLFEPKQDEPTKVDNPDGTKAEQQDDEAEETEETEGVEEELQEDDEESDLELAWKMLDIARVIHEKQHTHTLEEVDVIIALGDISLEKEEFSTCFEDYSKAVEILKGLVESDSRRLAELYFKYAMAQQLSKNPTDAIEYCQKASQICESRLQRLKIEVGDLQTDDQADEVKEIEQLLVDLKDKIEELKQMASAPSLMEALEAENPEVIATIKQTFQAVAAANNSISNGNGNLNSCSNSNKGKEISDSPVTHLGVVGRGIKRTAPIPITQDQGNVSQDENPSKRLNQEQ